MPMMSTAATPSATMRQSANERRRPPEDRGELGKTVRAGSLIVMEAVIALVRGVRNGLYGVR